MTIKRRDFLKSAAVAAAAPSALAGGSSPAHSDETCNMNAAEGAPIPDSWQGSEERFVTEWWAAAFFLGQDAERTHGYEPSIWSPIKGLDHYRIREFHAAAACQYAWRFYKALALVPVGYHTVERIAFGPGTSLDTPQFAVCYPFGCDEKHQAPIPPHSMETQYWLGQMTQELDETHYERHPECRPGSNGFGAKMLQAQRERRAREYAVRIGNAD